MSEIQTYSYHTHTDFSDGRCSLEEMVRRAKQIGFTEMGISDHLIVHKNIKQDPTWDLLEKRGATHIYNRDFTSLLERFKCHCDEIRRISKQENFKLYVGFEVDYFPYNGWEEELKWLLSQLDYDYVHTGNHYFCDETYEHVINMTFFRNTVSDSSLQKEYVTRHFDTLCQAVKSKIFKFLAHIDYVRRCGEDICSADSYMANKIKVLDALEQTGTALEISTKGLRKIGDFYPSQSVLTEVAKRNIMMVINDDAHSVSEIGADFNKAEAALKKLSISKRFKL